MGSEDKLYVSINPQEYIRGKSAVLESQANLLRSLKHINNLKVFSRQKNDLKIKLQKIMSFTLSEIDSIKTKMPSPEIPKTIKSKREKQPKRLKEKKSNPIYDSIDEELMQINKKISALRALA